MFFQKWVFRVQLPTEQEAEQFGLTVWSQRYAIWRKN